MERRLVGRRAAPSLRGPTVLTLAALVVFSGSGAAASRGTTPGLTGGQSPQTDPVGALAAELKYDPQQIFRYVADHVRYEPYSGILRGAAGTLSAGAGNSVDKALLLSTLLDDSRVSYRYARGPLDATTASTIIESIATDAAGARAAAEAPLREGLDELAAHEAGATGPLADLYRQQAGPMARDAATRFDLATSRLTETVALLRDALAVPGVSLSSADISLPSSELSDHTWVQMASGANWVDLDPTLPASAPGAVLTHAAETLTQLPDALRYRVTFNVPVETLSGGQLVTNDVLTYTGFADALAGTAVTFGHVTPSGLKSLGIAIGNLLGDAWLDYRPTLQVGGDSYVADRNVAFPLPGNTGGVFGTEPSPGGSPGPIDGEATAEWLEVSVTPPGGETSIARRTIFDRLPAELRATGQLTPGAIEPIELVDPDGSGGSDFLPMLGNRTFSIATGPTSAVPTTDTEAPLGSLARSYQGVRDAIDARAVIDAGARTFLDGPDIVSASVEITGDSPPANAEMGLDIWHRSHGILPLTGSQLSPAEARLVAGVADHVAERLAIDALVATEGASNGAITSGVGDVFEAAATQGIPTVVLQGSLPASLPYGATTIGLISDALASGDVVVIPAKPVTIGGRERVGWWTIDPDTGATTDVMDTGAGTAVTEEIVIVETRLGTVVCRGYFALGAAIMISAGVSSAVLLGGATSLSQVSAYNAWKNAAELGLKTTCA